MRRHITVPWYVALLTWTGTSLWVFSLWPTFESSEHVVGTQRFVHILLYPYLPGHEDEDHMGLEWTDLDSHSALVIYSLGYLTS